MIALKTQSFEVEFVTPAFLGGADQGAQWRTPPFKALLRHWWRVSAAKGCVYDVNRLRDDEGNLFGSANDAGGGSQKSKVRIRLDDWAAGGLETWDPTWNRLMVDHPEVERTQRRVGAHLYLGYGPLALKGSARTPIGIAARSRNTLKVAWEAPGSGIEKALQLAHWFGALGGRSRNGWGSLSVESQGEVGLVALADALQQNHPLLKSTTLPLAECLGRDWPHALGEDSQGPLVWRSRAFAGWPEAMQALADAKIKFRTSLSFAGAPPEVFHKRHLLGYPVSTNHSVTSWGGRDARLANQIRFKVARTAEGKFEAWIAHFPCDLPVHLKSKLGPNPLLAPGAQKEVWERVHQSLDTHTDFQRAGRGNS